MELDENYNTVTTKDCVELRFEEHFFNEDTKKDSVRTETWYFPNLKMALKKYINNKVSDCSDILDLVNEIENLERKIDNLKI